jgi:hypothetical protein
VYIADHSDRNNNPPMKPSLLIAIIVLLSAGCSKSIDILPSQAEPASPNAGGYITYTLKKGEHYADLNGYKTVDASELNFLVKFDSSAIYKTIDPSNQFDINKLYGFSDNNSMHHEFSARFGWRWSDNALRIFAYVYNNGVVISRELTAVAIGAETACSIKVTPENYLFTVGGETHQLPRRSTTPKGTGYRLYPYFGGDETAPHDVRIYIRQL